MTRNPTFKHEWPPNTWAILCSCISVQWHQSVFHQMHLIVVCEIVRRWRVHTRFQKEISTLVRTCCLNHLIITLWRHCTEVDEWSLAVGPNFIRLKILFWLFLFLAKSAPIVGFTIDQNYFTGANLWKSGANSPQPRLFWALPTFIKQPLF